MSDRYGLVDNNGYLVVEIPATKRFLPFRVVHRINAGYEVINYGRIPIESGKALPTLDGGTATVPEDGVLPARAYMSASDYVTFPASGVGLTYGVSDTDDIFYISEKDFTNRVIHLHAYVSPAWLRVMVDMPPSTVQSMYQKATLDINSEFGFARGHVETVVLPAVRMGWRFANDANFDVYTGIKFVYGEYVVDIVRDAGAVFDLLIGKIKARRVVLPINIMTYEIEEALNKVWGFTGFPIYGEHERATAISEYNSIIASLRR